jgi:hypothetical protein
MIKRSLAFSGLVSGGSNGRQFVGTYSFLIPGEVSLRVTLTELEDGSVKFDLSNEGDQVGDLRGLFFDFNDPSLLSSLSVSGGDVSESSFANDYVRNLGDGVNMNGVGVFDAGIAFGTAGISYDDIFATSFILSSSSGPLDLEMFENVEFGVRYTSVGDADGAREDSLKLVALSPDYVPIDPMDPPPI